MTTEDGQSDSLDGAVSDYDDGTDQSKDQTAAMSGKSPN